VYLSNLKVGSTMGIGSIRDSKGGDANTEIICCVTAEFEASDFEVEATRHNWGGKVETMGALTVGQ
jgi:hypothetical protein